MNIGSEKDLFKIEEFRALLKTPTVALPTVILFIVGSIAFFAGFWLYIQNKISIPTLMIFSIFGQYCVYSCLHEATHSNISKWQWVNTFIGLISSCILYSPYRGFQYIHLKHHRYTNVIGKDPDLWSAKKPLLWSWLTQDLFYYPIFFKEFSKSNKTHYYHSILQIFFLIILAVVICFFGYWQWVVFGWLLSKRLTIAILAFSFNYLPHLPHNPELQDNKYKETVARSSKILDFPFLMQNLHNIHHLYPSVPFYSYRKVWNLGKNIYLNQGTHEVKRAFQLY